MNTTQNQRGNSELNSELKPCPFCGGEAEIYAYEAEGATYDKDTLGFVDVEIRTVFGVGCPVCGCIIADKTSEQKAIEAWNRRAEK